MILGQNILYKKKDEWIDGYALDIDDHGGLVVVLNNGQNVVLNSGEITVRKSAN